MMANNKQRNHDLLPGKRRPDPGPWILYIIILCLFIAGGGYFGYLYFKISGKPKPVAVSDTFELKLYYPAFPAKLAVKAIPAKTNSTDREKADALVAALKENKVLPEEVSLTEFAADNTDGTLLLNFSHELTAMKPDPVTEIQTVYAITNSFLANFARAKNVQLLAGGEAFYTINGTVYTYKPLEFNSHILED